MLSEMFETPGLQNLSDLELGQRMTLTFSNIIYSSGNLVNHLYQKASEKPTYKAAHIKIKAKFKGHRPLILEENIFEGFLPYILHGSHLGHVTQIK